LQFELLGYVVADTSFSGHKILNNKTARDDANFHCGKGESRIYRYTFDFMDTIPPGMREGGEHLPKSTSVRDKRGRFTVEIQFANLQSVCVQVV